MCYFNLLHQLQNYFLDHTVQSSAVKGVSWTQPVLTKDKGAALPQGATSKSRRQKIQLHSFLSLTVKLKCQSGFTVVGIGWRVLRVLDG